MKINFNNISLLRDSLCIRSRNKKCADIYMRGVRVRKVYLLMIDVLLFNTCEYMAICLVLNLICLLINVIFIFILMNK